MHTMRRGKLLKQLRIGAQSGQAHFVLTIWIFPASLEYFHLQLQKTFVLSHLDFPDSAAEANSLHILVWYIRQPDMGS